MRKIGNKAETKAENKAVSEKNANKLKFDKDLFKRSVVYNVRTMYRKDLEEATPQQIYQAVSYAIPRWFTICQWNF